MGQNNKNKVLEIFYEYPNRRFTIREISKLIKVPRATVHKLLLKLKREKLITKENLAENNLGFKTKKINFFIEKIADSGLIEEITLKLNPSCIILFGSIRKGDSVKESDIDIFIETTVKKEIELKKFEKILGHKIQLFVEPDIMNMKEEIRNNIVNGIKLFGSLKIW